MRYRVLMVVGLAVAVTAGACGGSDSGDLVVEDPWGRSSPQVAANGAFYMILKGGETPDRLIGADAEVCGATELHQSIMTDGVMTMVHQDGGIEVPAHGEAVLEPGGYHVMCIDKTVEFKVGDVVPITLAFEHAGRRTVEAVIRDG